MDLILWILMSLLIGGLVAGVADRKGYSGLAWLFYSLLVWPIALVHVLALPTTQRRQIEDRATLARRAGRVPCPFCSEFVLATAKLCPHCRSDLAGQDLRPPPAPPRFGRGHWRLWVPLAIVAAVALAVLWGQLSHSG